LLIEDEMFYWKFFKCKTPAFIQMDDNLSVISNGRGTQYCGLVCQASLNVSSSNDL
jgi:hypothetical protein